MKTFQPLVSCIIPVYNAEKYLKQGIESLLHQSYTNLEIILVDDKSTDSSWDICSDYAKKYSNVYAFKSNKNSGAPLRGRERGIKEANGEWVTFMDCDDYVGPDYVKNLVKATKNGKYDISVTGHSRLYPDGKVEDFIWEDYTQTTRERLTEFFKHFFLDQDYWTDPSDTLGQSLIRADIAKNTDLSIYPDKVYGEDSLMALAFLANSKNGVNFVDNHDFFWRQVSGSGSHGGFSMTANRPSFYQACYDIFKNNKLLPTVSIVVPIFNVEAYLEECIDSILNQTYPNLEIILVDDRSPDKSGSIADELSAKDTRIKVIHKMKNEGLNMARSTGFKASLGAYVMFVDSDDMLVDDCVEVALRAMLNKSVDFIRFGMMTFKDRDDLSKKLEDRPVDRKITLRGKKDLYMTQFDPGRVLGDLSMNSMTVWGALYSRAKVNKINWGDVNFRIYEDNIWTLRFLENVASATYLSHVGYLYRFDSSLTNVLSKRLTGNDLNGKPIGYMEFWNYVWSEYLRYNKKYRIGANKIIEDVIKHLSIFRANYITNAGLWESEGNSRYFSDVALVYQNKIDELVVDNTLKDDQIYHLESENQRLNNELDSHMSIKRSAKLTLGNIKRRIGDRGRE